MTKYLGRIAAVTVVGALALAPIAFSAVSPGPTDISTVISVEGPTRNMVMPMAATVPTAAGIATVTDSTGQRVRMSRRSVGVLSLSTLKTAGVKVKWVYYPAFQAPYIETIGGVAPKGLKGWSFRVNGIAFNRSSNMVNLGRGDRVVWAWGTGKEPALTITQPATGSAPGATVSGVSVTAVITQVTTTGVRSPASGATVTYGGATVTTGADGTATFTTVSGVNVLRAIKAGRVPSIMSICTIGTSPECLAA
ncbi:MAG: DUF4430 domain-containing protein [Thermoleophilia bacterium]|nr:DUF4430 domain-containing protein [Thermoleophilia bacterium]